MTSSDPASVTPVPSIHTIPPDDSSTNVTVPTAELTQFQSWGTTLLNEVGNAIVMGLTNVVTDIEKPFEALATFGEEVLNGSAEGTQALADWTALFEGLGATASTATELATFLNDLATGNFSAALALLQQSIFGSATSPGILGPIPAPAVVNVTQNLQPVYDFPDAASVEAGGQWSWDGTLDHTGVAGSGSAKCIANGQLNVMRGIPGAVQAGQTVTPAGFVMWSGLAAAAGTSPIQLQLIPGTFDSAANFIAGTPVTVAEITSPGASSAWTALTPVTNTAAGVTNGVYTVPGSGVTGAQLRPVVTADATAGQINWDDCTGDVMGGFLADLDSAQTDIINSFAPGGTVEEFQTGVTNVLALLGLTPASVGGATAIDAVWTAILNDIINPLNALEVQATNIIGTIEQDAVSGLTNLNTGFTDIVDSFAPGGTAAEYQAGVSNLLALFGESSSTIQAATSEATVWNWVVANVLNPLNAIEVQATNIIGTIEQDAVNGLTNVWDWLTGTPTPTSTTTIAAAALPTVSIGGVNDTIENHIQNAVDTLNNAQTGGSATGTAISSLGTSYTNIPATNVVGQTGAAVTFGAVGAGNSSNLSSATSGSLSWSHTIATGDLCVLVFISYSVSGSAHTTNSSSVTYGGVAMTSLGKELSSVSGGAAYNVTEAWLLKAPPSGSKTVTASISGTTFGVFACNSVSYSASKVGAVGLNTGGGSATLSMSSASATGRMVVGAFGVSSNFSGVPALSAYTQTQRYNAAFGLVVGDAAGAASVAFGATASGTAANVQWSGITVELEN